MYPEGKGSFDYVWPVRSDTGVLSAYTVGDAMKALQAYNGLLNLTSMEKTAYDVAPLTTGGLPQGNGVVDLADVIMILRRIVGIGNW
jgi:hypothetical protein